MKTRLLNAAAGSLLLVLACSAPVAAAVSPETEVSAVNGFGLRLLADTEGENIVFSPYSIQMAMAMVYAGAAGETQAQMQKVLSYPKKNYPKWGGIRSLADLQSDIRPSSDLAIVDSANALAVNSGYRLLPQYLGLLEKNFDAKILRFNVTGSSAAAAINDWVKTQTRQRIPGIISPSMLSARTRLVIVSAIYFQSRWSTPFARNRTTKEPFYRPKGTDLVPMMHGEGDFRFVADRHFSVIGIPYNDPDFQLLIILPNPQVALHTVERALSPELLKKCAGLKPENIALSLPRFALHPRVWDLTGRFKVMGMPSAFDLPPGSANFSEMAPELPGSSGQRLAISQVLHQCMIDVTEDGTEAAAATAIEMATVGVPASPPRPIRVDRPFFFAIQHRPTGICLFLGRKSDFSERHKEENAPK